MYRKLAITALLLGGAASLGFLVLHKGTKTHAEVANKEILSVTVTSPHTQTIIDHTGVAGTLVPREETTVMAELTNVRILDVSAEVGDHVKKGDPLAVLDTEGLRLQLAQMEADYAKARDEATRTLSIKDTGAVSESLIMEKRSALATMKAKVEEAKLAIRRATVHAPTGGVVFERRALVGGIANATDPLFRIARDGEIEAELRVPEGQANRVKPASNVHLTVPGVQGSLLGSVRLVSPRIDASDRAAAVRVTVPSAQGLMVGGFVHGDIELNPVTALALPATAIQRDGEGAFVWEVDASNHVVRHPVTPLLQRDGMALVEGVTPDLRVVQRAGTLIRAGDFVKTVEAR
ncbi:efflux RND transporter periplasmic adaptor subunit [Azospirillum sp. RU38E]|uniref:efflux RND transporter periplasmic adaptor subunit n=1 Tax=Azospirillum sp. RU38E TaxID=1907313 RepID=UPI000B6923A7|nr:efflux RND transporter periplasmic adaptor subunit [Azospirillum sp. RU38E]SNS13964.1 HlyD family secretion protein [Azospirillum sp. RU38E]SNS31115.1 HlyD family secretion protein [Azospirillum sp. RU37A]